MDSRHSAPYLLDVLGGTSTEPGGPGMETRAHSSHTASADFPDLLLCSLSLPSYKDGIPGFDQHLNQ